MKRKRNENQPSSDPLDRALADWKALEDPPEQLSPHLRARVLDAAAGGADVGTPVPRARALFFPVRRFALAAVVPTLALALALGSLVRPVPVSDPDREAAMTVAATRLEVQRHGDEVIFRIANGSTQHRVYKSTDLGSLDTVTPVVVEDGVFRDRVEQDSGIVFYRID